ncbi:unnamed protein product [Didymodactylos carnosus]|uniref:PDEase domain-containing protein n=1 Tax=Didymodactylos carnosus TaxID=1234261 RepID=A0A813QCC7_9BILA|nr:unnamed protein product [Didymodactylos carnosus]CAF3546861.1 unnamed protein product [Didymodactylos carnosus]
MSEITTDSAGQKITNPLHIPVKSDENVVLSIADQAAWLLSARPAFELQQAEQISFLAHLTQSPLTLNQHFNVLQLPAADLVHYAYSIFKHSGCLIVVPTVNLAQWYLYLTTIMHNHSPENHYHNWYHAVHVLLNCYRYVYPLLSQLQPLDIFALLLAALNHDLDHCGISNTALINQVDPLAVKYHKVSPLEQHSIDRALEILNDEAHGTALLQAVIQPNNNGAPVTNNEHNAAKSRVIEIFRNSILATDISRTVDHEAILTHYLTFHNHLDYTDSNQCLQLLTIILLCGDIGCVCEPFYQSMQWCGRLYEEMQCHRNSRQSNDIAKVVFQPQSSLENDQGLYYSLDNKLILPPSGSLSEYYTNQLKFLEYYAIALYARVSEPPSCSLGHLSPYTTRLRQNLIQLAHSYFLYEPSLGVLVKTLTSFSSPS